MGRKKAATERYETTGINKVLDFEQTEENATLSTVEESECPSAFRGPMFQSQGPSEDVGTQSISVSNPTSVEHYENEGAEETSLTGTEGE